MKLLISFLWLAYFHAACGVFNRGPRIYRLVRPWVKLTAFQSFWAAWFRRLDFVAILPRMEPARAFMQRFARETEHG